MVSTCSFKRNADMKQFLQIRPAGSRQKVFWENSLTNDHQKRSRIKQLSQVTLFSIKAALITEIQSILLILNNYSIKMSNKKEVCSHSNCLKVCYCRRYHFNVK